MLINAPKRIAPDLAFHPEGHVNVYFVGRPGADWVLVDTGRKGHAKEVLAAAEARFGHIPPRAIVLTHGHADHSGNARELALHWRVPILTHPLEIPFLTGHQAYPPPDPLVGGFLAIASIFLPTKAPDLSGFIEPLPDEIPGISDWQWIHVPGHAPGQIALYRASDKTLIASDALATVDMDSATGLMKKEPRIARSGAPFIYDWQAAVESVRHLANLEPQVIAAGHGLPISGPDVPAQLRAFAEEFVPPRRGRYVQQAAKIDDNGIVSLPPPAPFAWIRVAWRSLFAAVAAACSAGWLLTRRRRVHR